MTVMHPFDAAIDLTHIAPGQTLGRTDPQWANMVGPFGGITAATLLRAIEHHPDRQGQPLAMTVNFLAPLSDGEFVIRTRTPRTNRTNQHWLAELSQRDTTMTTASAVFARRRDAWSTTEVCPPVVLNPDDVAPGLIAESLPWVHHYDMRFVTGPMPTNEQEAQASSTTTLWIRHRQHRPLDFAALTALCDVFYPRVYLRLGQFVPAGTISLTVYVHADEHDLAVTGDGFVLATARAQRFSHGYFDQTAQIWNRAGTLLATTHQIVYYKT